MRVDNTLSSWKQTHGESPKVLYWGQHCFQSWYTIFGTWRVKCVDKTTKLVFITENSHWTTICEVHSVLIFNPKYATRAKYINWCTRSWESVCGYTLQGVIITANFWNDQVDYISMASKKLSGWRRFPLLHDQWDAIAWWGL